MTTQAPAIDEARAIWDQIEAEESGKPIAVEPAQTEPDGRSDDGAAQAAPERVDPPNEQHEVEDDPKVLRNKIAGLESMLNQLSGRVRNTEGHIGGLNSQVKQAIDAAKATATAAGADAPSAKEIRDAQESPEALAALTQEYPEFAKHLKPALDATNSRIATLEKQLREQQQAAPAQPAVQGVSREDLDARDAALAVEFKHPGWKKVVAQAEFRGFVESAPREVRLLSSSDDPEDAIRLLDLYAESKAERPATTQQNTRLKSAAALPNGSRSGAKAKSVDEMTPAEYWRYLDQLDKQKD